MKIFKENKNAQIPVFATKGSACFDLTVCIDETTKIKSYNPHNRETIFPAKKGTNGKYSISIPPQFRVLLPTGLIFDIPEKYVLKLAIRSSMALKYGLRLANSIAIIDSDYVEQTYIMVINDSDTPMTIFDGDRVAQGWLEEVLEYTLEETTEPPTQKTDRVGGLGSTGVAELITEEKTTQSVAKKQGGRPPKVEA